MDWGRPMNSSSTIRVVSDVLPTPENPRTATVWTLGSLPIALSEGADLDLLPLFFFDF